MSGKQQGPQQRSRGGLRELGRWIVAALGAAAITVFLFGGMVGLVDGRWILEKVIRVFPLEEQSVREDDLLARPDPRKGITLRFEGTVGHLVRDRFVPLEDAEILGTRPDEEPRRIAVEPGGHFRFEASFPEDRISAPSATQLLVRSPGCRDRRVPVTRAWMQPRRIALDCG